jgi:tetratricopeptide (TPR) repeat protein
MMFWVALGITVTGGMLAGHYVIGAATAAARKPEDEAAAEEASGEEDTAGPPAGDTPGKRRGTRKRGGRGSSSARAGAARVASSRRSTTNTNPAAYALYALIAAVMLGSVWWFNLSTIYADMRFHEGQSLSQQQGAGLREQILAMDKFITTINNNPREDFYYLNLGRTMMNIAQQLRAQEMPLGTERDDVSVNDVLALGDVTAVANFVQNHTPLEIMSYARAVLKQARDLNSMNKDHYANLARLNNFWYQWTQDVAKLQQSSDWYEQANEIAPQDVTLLNEHANVLMMLSTTSAASGQQDYQQRAIDILERSFELDPKYADTSARLAEMYRINGQLAEAADMYVHAIERNPDQINPLVERIAASYQSEPELLDKISTAYLEMAKEREDPILYSIGGLLEVRAGDMEDAIEPYKQAAALDPRNLENRRNYAIVLSDTQQYDEALRVARSALEFAQTQEGKENDVRLFQHLISLIQPKVAGGQ